MKDCYIFRVMRGREVLINLKNVVSVETHEDIEYYSIIRTTDGRLHHFDIPASAITEAIYYRRKEDRFLLVRSHQENNDLLRARERKLNQIKELNAVLREEIFSLYDQLSEEKKSMFNGKDPSCSLNLQDVETLIEYKHFFLADTFKSTDTYETRLWTADLENMRYPYALIGEELQKTPIQSIHRFLEQAEELFNKRKATGEEPYRGTSAIFK